MRFALALLVLTSCASLVSDPADETAPVVLWTLIDSEDFDVTITIRSDNGASWQFSAEPGTAHTETIDCVPGEKLCYEVAWGSLDGLVRGVDLPEERRCARPHVCAMGNVVVEVAP